MIITAETPGVQRLLVIKGGVPVGLVQEVDTETQRMKRYDLREFQEWINGGPEPDLIEDTYDELQGLEA